MAKKSGQWLSLPLGLEDLLCVLCESSAFFAVKVFFTAKLAKNCRPSSLW